MTMTAAEMKDRLRSRHAASGGQMPGAWTCLEEWMGIDLLAWSSWQSDGNYMRIGYEVKVSRSDLRRELLKPGKRARAVEWCNEFYFAVPKGLLKDEEIAYDEPEWEHADFQRTPCTRAAGRYDYVNDRERWRNRCHGGKITVPFIGPINVWQRFRDQPRYWPGWDDHSRSPVEVPCPECDGLGYLQKSRVEREAPTLWIPRDVGLVIVDGNGTRMVRKSPRRMEVPSMSPMTLGQLIRWVSMRPDPRHLS